MEGYPAVPAVTAAMVARSRGLAGPRFSPDGRRLAWAETAAGRSDIVVAPADASSPPVVVTADAAAGPFGGFTWAGTEIVYGAADGRLVAVPGTGGPLRVLSPDGEAAAPAASADGSRIAFVLERDDRCDIAVVPTDGSAWPARLSTGADWAIAHAWAPDGRAVALCRNEGGFGRLVVAPIDGDARPVGKGWHHYLDWGPAGIAAVRSGGVTPTSVVVADPEVEGARRVLAVGAPGALVAAGPVEPEPVSWTGEDGGAVHGLLYRPATSALGPGTAPPMIVYVHGGPTGSSAVTWWPRPPFWVARGWA